MQALPAPPGLQSEASDPDILVTGERGGLSERVGAFVTSVTAETGNDHVARWDRRLCLSIEGVSAAQRDFFGRAIGAAGRELGLDVARDGGCEPAAVLIFTADPDALLARLAATRPRFFGSIPPARRRELEASAPVRWLSFAQLRGAEGETPSSFYVDAKSGTERPVPALRTAPSRLQRGSRMDLQSMVVIVDASRMAGVSNRSLSAFLAMVVLGNVRPDHGIVGPVSILGLFAEARPDLLATEGLTDWDRAYLRALYSGRANLSAGQSLQRIGAGMERELVRAGDPRRESLR